MAECPQCKAEIGRSSYCGCGWKRYAKQSGGTDATPRVKCCHDLCGFDAFCKIKTPTGWANFCHQHYDEYFKRIGDAYCAERGLVTPDQRKSEWTCLFSTFKRLKAATREPGQDDDEIAA